MKLGSLITEVSDFFVENGTFLFQEYAFSLREHYPHFKILMCEL